MASVRQIVHFVAEEGGDTVRGIALRRFNEIFMCRLSSPNRESAYYAPINGEWGKEE